MLEPLFRCNLACAGCGKIDYPEGGPRKSDLSLDECLDAVDECGAPIVSIPGGEPLIHPEIAGDRRRHHRQARSSSTSARTGSCSRSTWIAVPAVGLPDVLGSPRRTEARSTTKRCAGTESSSIAVSGDQELRASARLPRHRQLHAVRPRRTPSALPSSSTTPWELGVEGDLTISPGFQYERAPRQDVFLKTRPASKQLFRDIFKHWQEERVAEVAVQPVEPVSRLPRRQPELSSARPGATRRATSSAGSAPAT